MSFTAQIVTTLTVAQYLYVKTPISSITQVNEEMWKVWVEMNRAPVYPI